MCRWFITGTCHWLLDNDDLRLRSSSSAQMFQYRDAVLVSPVVDYHAEEVDRDFFLLGTLRFKEVLGLGAQC